MLDTSITVPLLRRPSPLVVDPHVLVPASFELGRRLGGGGMGVVFEARHVLLHRWVALKFIDPDATSPGIARARLLREARALARLNHPHVVTLFEVGATSDSIFLAMELVEGGTLADWIRTPHDWREIIDVFLKFGGGLAAAHQLGIVHRDIKPSNILLDGNGSPKIGDFGLATSEPRDGLDAFCSADPSTPSSVHDMLTMTGNTLGTPAYMAPEQARGDRVDARADQFAFCMSLHEALTGRLPGDDRGGRAVPRPLRSVVSRGLAAEPRDRFPAMTELLTALERARRQRVTAGSAAAT